MNPAASKSGDLRADLLGELAVEIGSHEDWWLFPTQGPIQGFMGTDPLFIVGDQPATAEWGPGHPSRTIFYQTLQSVGLYNAHLTDLYKKRGYSSSLDRTLLPDDFLEHVNFLRKEIQILRPKLIVGLGQLAQRLLKQSLPEWRDPIPRIYHFSYVVKEGLEPKEYENNMRDIILGK
jgi:hypothetical protein